MQKIAELCFHREFHDVAVAVEDMEGQRGEYGVAKRLALVLVVRESRLRMPCAPFVKTDFCLGVRAGMLANDHAMEVDVILVSFKKIQQRIVAVFIKIDSVAAQLAALLGAAKIVVDGQRVRRQCVHGAWKAQDR